MGGRYLHRVADHWMQPLGRAAGSLILVTGGVLLPVGAASAAPLPQVTAVLAPADSVMSALSLQQDRRLANGQFVRLGRRNGEGHLAITNNSSHDAVVTLARNRNAVYSVYVRKGMQFTVTGVRDGTYETFFTAGTDWDSPARAFTRDRAFLRFDDPLEFTTTRSQTTTWQITLSGVPNGNAKVSDVDPNDYPAP